MGNVELTLLPEIIENGCWSFKPLAQIGCRVQQTSQIERYSI
jgi:hypothetical protein